MVVVVIVIVVVECYFFLTNIIIGEPLAPTVRLASTRCSFLLPIELHVLPIWAFVVASVFSGQTV